MSLDDLLLRASDSSFDRYEPGHLLEAVNAIQPLGKDDALAAIDGFLAGRDLASDPDLLLLDEPTAGLDAHVEEGFYRLLQELNQRLTIVMVSHDLGFVSGFVKSVICVGKDVCVHPTSEVTGEEPPDGTGPPAAAAKRNGATANAY